MRKPARFGRATIAVAAFALLGVVGSPQAAHALTCSVTAQVTGAQQSSGTSLYYGNWLNIYNYNHQPNICGPIDTDDFLAVALPASSSSIEFGFDQADTDPSTTDYFFAAYQIYPASPTTLFFGTANTVATYSIRAYDSAVDGKWTLDETAGSTFTTVYTTPNMGASTGKMSGAVTNVSDADSALLTNWADTQNRYGGGWGHWTNEVCAPGANNPNWKINFGTIGDFYTSNFTHSGAC